VARPKSLEDAFVQLEGALGNLVDLDLLHSRDATLAPIAHSWLADLERLCGRHLGLEMLEELVVCHCLFLRVDVDGREYSTCEPITNEIIFKILLF